jgi:hypothetical protein
MNTRYFISITFSFFMILSSGQSSCMEFWGTEDSTLKNIGGNIERQAINISNFASDNYDPQLLVTSLQLLSTIENNLKQARDATGKADDDLGNILKSPLFSPSSELEETTELRNALTRAQAALAAAGCHCSKFKKSLEDAQQKKAECENVQSQISDHQNRLQFSSAFIEEKVTFECACGDLVLGEYSVSYLHRGPLAQGDKKRALIKMAQLRFDSSARYFESAQKLLEEKKKQYQSDSILLEELNNNLAEIKNYRAVVGFKLEEIKNISEADQEAI